MKTAFFHNTIFGSVIRTEVLSNTAIVGVITIETARILGEIAWYYMDDFLITHLVSISDKDRPSNEYEISCASL